MCLKENLIELKKFCFIETVNKTDRLDRSQWKQYQNLMQDCGKFVDLVHTIEWEDGLKSDMTQSRLI